MKKQIISQKKNKQKGSDIFALPIKISTKPALIFVMGFMFLISCQDNKPGRTNSHNSVSANSEISSTELLSKEVFQILHENPSQARDFALQKLDSIKDTNAELNVELLKHIGTSYSIEGDFLRALEYYSGAITIADQYNYARQIADINNNIGVVNRTVGNYKNAFIHFTKAIEYYHETGNVAGMANSTNNKGLMYKDLENHDKARRYLEEALAGFEKSKDTIGIAIALSNLSVIYSKSEDYRKAFAYQKESSELAEITNNQYLLSISYGVKGNMYYALNQPLEALKAYERSIEIGQKSNQPYQVATAMLGIAKTQLLRNEQDDALVTASQTMEIATDLNNIILKNRTHYILYKIYKKKNNHEKGLEHFAQYIDSQEQLLNQTIIHQIYDFEIETLSKANELKQLELERKELAISKKNNLLLFATIVFVLIIIALYFFYQNIRNRQHLKLHQTISQLTKKKSHAAVEAEIQERKRIGQELHDCLGQMLSVAGLHISILQHKKDLSEKRKENLLNAAMHSVDEAFAEVRNISHNLAPSLLSERGLEGALKNLADQVNQSHQLHMDFETYGLNGKLNSLVENTLFRSIQEILNNAIKHSKASTLTFHITQGSNDINLMAEDNGKGFNPEKVTLFQGNGLHHMKSRIENLNGSIHIDSTPLRGTIISIVIPLKPERTKELV